MATDCIFCKIIKGESPATFVYKDDDMVVFHNTRPSAPVHVLIVPREHIESVNALEEKHSAIISKMMVRAKEIARLLGIRDSGYKLVINVGSGAGQVIFHLHIHLIGGWGSLDQPQSRI
ncbi:MAG: histidine triad nucleotide-binding protein [Candidatus Methanoperedens sp.]|nr:histidine triad nucleotide-binding protein [Candidatus Methanoperedens sp.]